MKSFHEYWTFSAIRGALTVLASMFIFIAPQGLAFVFKGPLSAGLAITFLATFSIFDGGVVVLLAHLLPARATHRTAFYGQAFMAVFFGLLLYMVVGGAVSMPWLMLIVASQAGLAALSELRVALDTHQQYGCLSCYATPIVLGVSAIVLPFASRLDAAGMTIALASYTGLHGASELVLGGRMLFLEYRSEHPAILQSEAWRKMLNSPLPEKDRKECVSCADCPADARCHDDSLPGQIARVIAERRPAIVQAIRVDALLEAAASGAA
jgi:hypothetical protein